MLRWRTMIPMPSLHTTHATLAYIYHLTLPHCPVTLPYIRTKTPTRGPQSMPRNSVTLAKTIVELEIKALDAMAEAKRDVSTKAAWILLQGMAFAYRDAEAMLRKVKTL